MVAVSGIYLVRNKVDGRVYVGQSIDMSKRWRMHKGQLNRDKHYNTFLQRAWNKYGAENFEFSILEERAENLTEAEAFWIDHFCACQRDMGYNFLPAGNSMKGLKHSEATKVKMRKPKSEETKRAMRKPKSESHRRSMSKTQNQKNNASKLNWDQVREIRRRLQSGDGFELLGREFDVAPLTIRNIKYKIRWANDPMEPSQDG